jgi:hypothetical protein
MQVVCKAGETSVGSRIQTSGFCKIPLNERECKIEIKRRAELGLDPMSKFTKKLEFGFDISLDRGRWPNDPFYCIRTAESYAYNHHKSVTRRNQKECGTNGFTCLCRDTTCMKCPKNTYSVGGMNPICKVCPISKPYTWAGQPQTSELACKETSEPIRCEAGTGVVYSRIRSEGLCEEPIMSAKECEIASGFNKHFIIGHDRGFKHKTDKKHSSFRPVGCYKSLRTSQYFFNSPHSGSVGFMRFHTPIQKRCGDGSNNCICQNKECQKCPPGTYNSKGGMNTICLPCHTPSVTNAERTTCTNKYTQIENHQTRMNILIGQIAKRFEVTKNYENERSGGVVDKFKRVVRDVIMQNKYDKMRLKEAASGAYQKHGVKACQHEDEEVELDETRRSIHIFPALPLHDEVNDVTCLSTNRDELVSAFCNFRRDFDVTLSERGIGKTGRDFWPNICCSGDDCNSTKVDAEYVVPFALSEGGKITKDSLYGEILDVLRAAKHHKKKRGYLLQGMLDAIDSIAETSELKKDLIKLFHKIHLCGPRVFQSPDDESIKLCELFYPYRKLMKSFYDRFKRLFQSKDLNLLVAQDAKLQKREAKTDVGMFLEINSKLHGKTRTLKKTSTYNRGDVCRLALKENELIQKRKMFCSMYQPFDSTDERITNIAMFRIRNDIGHQDNFVRALSNNARFVASDKCFHTAPMLSSNGISLQKIKIPDLHEEWMLVATLQSSKGSYLRTVIQNCNGRFLPEVKVNFGIYVDEHNCCGTTKDVASCEQCSSKKAPQPLYHHWINEEKLFYEMTVTGIKFELKLDGNPILSGTKYTSVHKLNAVKPRNMDKAADFLNALNAKLKTYGATEGHTHKNIANPQSPSLLQVGLGSWETAWETFVESVRVVPNDKGVVGSCDSTVLHGIIVKDDSGTFEFKCTNSPALCICIEHIAKEGEEQRFVSGDFLLEVYRHTQSGSVSYTIFQKKRRRLDRR